LKILSAIVLLLWTVCYGRCLAEQNGLLKGAPEAWHCEHACGCEEETDQSPPPGDDGKDCEVCDFISFGGAPTGSQFVLDIPVLFPLPEAFVAFAAVVLSMDDLAAENVAANDTGPPRRWRICEWMACTATPVRGPNARV